MRTPSMLLISICTLLVGAPALAKNKVQHKTIEAPSWAGPAVEVDIGTVTHMKAGDGVLFLAGQRGIAAVDTQGVVQWSTELPEAMVRNLAVDGDGVAFTAWTLAGVEDRGKALNRWASGKMLDKFDVQGASVGFLGLDGGLKWQVDAVDQHPLSPPGLSGGVVGVNTGEHVAVHSKADGSVVGSSEMVGAKQHSGSFAGVLDHGTRGEMVPIGEHFFTSFFSYLYQVDLEGNLVDKEFMAGLTPYVDITCGPVKIADLVAFGSTGDSNVQSAFFAMKENMKNKWKTWSKDEQSGCGDLVVHEDRLYASSNFWVMAIDPKGKIKWDAVNKKGGLYPSANRGIRYIPGSSFGTRKSYGDLMVVGGGRVWLATDNGHDVITVLDAESGDYIKTLDVNETLVSMAVIADRLAVATDSGLRLLELGS